jgi:hypothetical protein
VNARRGERNSRSLQRQRLQSIAERNLQHSMNSFETFIRLFTRCMERQRARGRKIENLWLARGDFHGVEREREERKRNGFCAAGSRAASEDFKLRQSNCCEGDNVGRTLGLSRLKCEIKIIRRRRSDGDSCLARLLGSWQIRPPAPFSPSPRPAEFK